MFQQLASSPGRWRRLPAGGSDKTKDFLLGGADFQAGRKITYVMFIDDAERCLKGLVHFGTATEGPKGYVHGGASAAMLDMAMGNLCWWSGLKSVTAEMTVKYRSFLPLDSTVLVEAHIESSTGRKHIISSSLSQFPPDDSSGPDAAGVVYSSGSGLFIQMRQHPSDTASKL